MEKPLLEFTSTGEMSTCLGQSDQLSSMEHPRGRSVDSPGKRRGRTEQWNSWTGMNSCKLSYNTKHDTNIHKHTFCYE